MTRSKPGPIPEHQSRWQKWLRRKRSSEKMEFLVFLCEIKKVIVEKLKDGD
jgi:hypothetical protein